MRYLALKTCTDTDGRFFSKGEEADLNPKLAHSKYLIAASGEVKTSADADADAKAKAEAETKSKAEAKAEVKAETEAETKAEAKAK